MGADVADIFTVGTHRTQGRLLRGQHLAAVDQARQHLGVAADVNRRRWNPAGYRIHAVYDGATR